MYELHHEMYDFYQSYVRLSAEQKAELTNYRDLNYERLQTGLKKLGYPNPIKKMDQGSYAMHTTNQHPENEYDIDVAIIFDKENLPSSPLDARMRIQEAMREGGGNFSRLPEARTNAVTVWYQEGHHVDLAIHRENISPNGGKTIEHAGTEWTVRDPMSITNWFIETGKQKSPSKENGAEVPNGQMGRVIQLLKFFAKSRKSWNLPGGLIISTLVGNECYIPNPESDEKALYETIKALSNRLQINVSVANPIDSAQLLTYKEEYTNQVIRFKTQLEKAIEWLSPIQETDCEKKVAVEAWAKFFTHEFWDDLGSSISKNESDGNALRLSSYVTSTGAVSSIMLNEQHIDIPSHRYYGADKA